MLVILCVIIIVASYFIVRIAIAAKTRLENANKFTELTPSKLDDELLAYFIEEAVYKGVDPLGVSKQSSAFGDFFKRLINAVKNLKSDHMGNILIFIDVVT